MVNDLVLTGILAADPATDEGRDGEPVTLLLVAFPAPDSKDLREPEAACCEVEVPGHVADLAGHELRAGESIHVTGHLSGGGGVIASEVRPGPLDRAA